MHKHAFPLLRLKAMSLTIVESSFLLMLTDTSVHLWIVTIATYNVSFLLCKCRHLTMQI